MKKRITAYILLLLFCLSSLCFATDVTLLWTANTEPDLAGYKIYYKNDSSGAPYNGIGINQGNSPIEIVINEEDYIPGTNHYINPDNPRFVLTGLNCDNHTYYLAVTAFDNEKPLNESGYSNEVNTNGGGGGGGSGGCFILTIQK